jgi:hypothetical protein
MWTGDQLHLSLLFCAAFVRFLAGVRKRKAVRSVTEEMIAKSNKAFYKSCFGLSPSPEMC